MVLNWCPSNVKLLLIGTFGLTGVVQVSQWGQSEYLPIFAQKNLGFSHRQESSDGSVLPLLPISSQTESSASKAKAPRNTGKRFGRSPVVQLSCSSPVSPHQAVERALPEQTWGISHPECVTRADMDPADPHLGLDLIHCAQAALGETREA